MAILKPGRLCHHHDGHLVFREDYPSTVYLERKSTVGTTLVGNCVGIGDFGLDKSSWAQRTLTRAGTQNLFTFRDITQTNGDKYAGALLLGADGYWYFYYYVGIETQFSRVKALSNVTSWDTGGANRIYQVGGLDTSWAMVGIRFRSPTLFGTYDLTGRVASSNVSWTYYWGSGDQPWIRISRTTTRVW